MEELSGVFINERGKNKTHIYIFKIKKKNSHQTQRVNLSGLVFIVEIIGA